MRLFEYVKQRVVRAISLIWLRRKIWVKPAPEPSKEVAEIIARQRELLDSGDAFAALEAAAGMGARVHARITNDLGDEFQVRVAPKS